MTTTAERSIEVPLVKNSNITENIAIPDKLKILRDQEKVKKWERCFRFLTPKDGDKRIVWDSRDMSQIEEAKVMFDECVAKGLVPYRVGVDGNASSDIMDEFDPDAEEVIFLPIARVQGG